MSKENGSTIRLFYALWPDAETRAQLVQLQTHAAGRLTSPANLHLTLAFLGDQPMSRLPMLRDILGYLPAPAMTLELNRLGYFTRQRIAWAGMHQPPQGLDALQQALVAALDRHHIAFDRRSKFKPHVTLARNAGEPADPSFQPIVWHATQVALVESQLHASGVQYRVLAQRELAAPQPGQG